jgi:PDDEXK-like domain of unknown function (DUF3799)
LVERPVVNGERAGSSPALGATPAPKPGLYRGVPSAEYRAWDAINASLLRKLRTAPPAQLRHDAGAPDKQTPAKLFGTVLHALLLEPGTFDDAFVVSEPLNLQRKADREYWETFQEDALRDGQTPVRREVYDQACAMERACLADPEVRRLLEAPGGVNEGSVVWIDDVTHFPCKMRFDRIVEVDGETLLLDVKTAHSAGMDAFGRAIERDGYHLAAAWYLRGAERAQIADFRPPFQFRWLVFDKEEPYLPAFYAPDLEDLEYGARECARLTSLYVHCRRTDTWPGYMVGGKALVCPRPGWARFRDRGVYEEQHTSAYVGDEEIDF